MRTSATILSLDAEGHAFANLDIPPALTGLTGAAITVEQEGGAEEPGVLFAAGRVCGGPAAK